MAAGLPAPSPSGGEGAPDGPGLTNPGKALRSAAITFRFAAVVREHNVADSEIGLANARHDYRVWDLVEQIWDWWRP